MSVSRQGITDLFDASFGIIFSQILLFGISPVLSRLYTPLDFGYFAIFMALVSVFSIIVTGRYELAILIPRNNKHAAQLVLVAIFLCFIISIAMIIVFLVFRMQLASMVDYQQGALLIAVAIVSVFFAGLISAFNYWLIRQKLFRNISYGRVAQSIVVALFSVAFGMLGAGAFGIVLGFVAGQVTRLAHLIYSSKPSLKKYAFKAVPLKAISLVKKFWEFPILNAPAALINGLKTQMPVFFMSANYSSTQVGHYEMVNRSLGAPSSFIGLAIADVFHQRIAVHLHQGQSLFPLTIKLAVYLFLIALGPIIIVVLFGPTLFEFVFGDQWRLAGEYASILAPAFLVRFVTSPLSRVFIVNNQIRLNSAWQAASFATMLVTVIFASNYDFRTFIIFVSAHEIIAYLLYFLAALFASKSNIENTENV